MLDKAVEGDQEYVLPLTELVPIEAEAPVQIAVLDPAEAAGNEFTVTVTELEATHPLLFVSVTV